MEKWLNSNNVSDELKDLIKTYDEKQLHIAFNTKIEFGTAGMRGTMGAGYGYINENIVNWATIGYAKYLNNKFKDCKVVIAYDNRKNSENFARLCANVLSNLNVNVYLFSELKSTPQLSYAIRELDAHGGINITASHNPKSDNGYKLYDENGCQYLPAQITEIKDCINEIKDPLDVKLYNSGNEDKVTYLNDDSSYVNFVAAQTNNNFKKYEKILITPLHGCSGNTIKQINDTIKFENIDYVTEQMHPDSNFTTVESPNPDSVISYQYAIENNLNDSNYILANDPDADRVGVYDVVNKVLFSGNQIASLLMQYLIDTNQYSTNDLVITSNVSSMLPIEIAKKHNLNKKIVLTGFKYIGNLIDEDSFLFGYEESNGYLMHTKTRDKDGIASAFKIIEMINYYFNQNISLNEKLQSIYQEYGYYVDRQSSIFVDDMSIVETVIDKIDFNTFEDIAVIENYNTQTRLYLTESEEIQLPKANVLKVIFKDNSWFAIRPSGTEPKIKIYYSATSNNIEKADQFIDYLETYLLKLFK